jgi:hypothetical protein
MARPSSFEWLHTDGARIDQVTLATWLIAVGEP